MKKIIFVLIVLFNNNILAKDYKLKIDKFNNQKTYIGKTFAKVGTAAGARMFGGDDGKLWASKIIPGDDFEEINNNELLHKLNLTDFKNGFYTIMGSYYTKKINSIDKKDSMTIKIGSSYYKYDLTYYDTKPEVNSDFGGWVSTFGYMIPLGILKEISTTEKKVLIRVKGDYKDLTVDVKGSKLKKLRKFLKSVK